MLSSRNKNRKKEEIHFAQFKECCKYLPPIDDFKHDDKPDFLIYHNTGTLGIEHTQLFKISKRSGRFS